MSKAPERICASDSKDREWNCRNCKNMAIPMESFALLWLFSAVSEGPVSVSLTTCLCCRPDYKSGPASGSSVIPRERGEGSDISWRPLGVAQIISKQDLWLRWLEAAAPSHLPTVYWIGWAPSDHLCLLAREETWAQRANKKKKKKGVIFEVPGGPEEILLLLLCACKHSSISVCFTKCLITWLYIVLYPQSSITGVLWP